MPAQDTSQLKEKILQTIRRRGPSLPVHIAGETGLSILFASAFLSELISDRKIKISHLRVGSSPVYFIPGQEPQLERYSHHLKSKEKDAYLLLKEKKFLEDSSQDPAIRVALRSIRDFAIGFQKSDKIFWRYFTVPESEFENKIKIIEEKPEKTPEPKKEINKEENTPRQIPNSLLTEVRKNLQEKEDEQKIKETKPEKDELNIFDKKEIKEETKKEKKKVVKKKAAKKKTSSKKNEQFFIRVKEFLNEKSIEILDIESFNKDDLVLKIKQNNKEKILVAYNKKRITELDIINAAKKSENMNLPYIILSTGGPLKKLENLIDAVRNLSGIEKL